MPRRRYIVIVSAVVLLTLGVLAGVAFLSITQTDYGRDYVRRLLIARLQPSVKGRLYIGKLGGGLLHGVTVDSLEIRDDEDSLFVASGPLFVQVDARDLLDRRVLIRRVEVQRPVVRVRQYENGEWNYRRVFPKGRPKPPGAEPGFGHYIVIDTATVHDASFTLVMPWHPADSLRGARRDSAIAFNVRNVPGSQCGTLPLACLNEVRQTHEREGVNAGKQTFAKVWRWTRGELASTYIRLADPDSGGRYFDIRKLDIEESNPPFAFRNLAGGVKIQGDSAWVNVTHFDLPEGSRGKGAGKVVWGSGLPARYNIRVTGDTISLADFSQKFDSARAAVVPVDSSWLYPTLPRVGGGRLVLDIRSNPRDPRLIDYVVSNMDVRTTAGSHLTGSLTFGTGGPVLAVKDVAVTADPVDFQLLRQFNGQPFPYPWAGRITGTVRASGGPLNRFRIESADVVFRDANVRGATTVATARGELDILRPAFTVFRGFDVNVDQLDLRTLQFLNPNFPRVSGYVAGSARLDSSWLDVRFRDADLRHFDGPGEPSHATGSGRVTWGEVFLTYDLDLETLPVNFTTLARSYPMLPVRGSYRGPLRVQGTLEDLDLDTELTGPAGVMAVSGHFDLYPALFTARATGRVAGLDLRTLLDATQVPAAPTTNLTADFTANLAGDSLPNLAGSLVVHVDRSMVDSVRVYGAQANLELADGLLRVDTLVVESSAASLTASGGIGLVAGRADSLRIQATVDSLGGLRRYILGARRGVGGNEDINAVAATEPGGIADSLTGTLGLIGSVSGSLDSLVLAGKLVGNGIFVGGTQAKVVDGAFAITGLRGEPKGTARLNLDTLTAAGLHLRHAGAELQIHDSRRADFRAIVASQTGERLESVGRWRMVEHAVGGTGANGATSGAAAADGVSFASRPRMVAPAQVDGIGAANGAATGAAALTPGAGPAPDVMEQHYIVDLDTLTLALDSTSRYELARRPARITLHEQGVQIDSLELRHLQRGWARVYGGISDAGSVDLSIAAESLSLGDLARLAQARSATSGLLGLDLRVTGTRDRPLLRASGSMDSVVVGSARLERIGMHASYDSTRLDANVDVFRGGRRALEARASLPLNLALRPVAERRIPDDSLFGRVRTDSVGLAIIEAFSDQFRETRGELEANVDLGGTWRQPVLTGHLGISGGEMLLLNTGTRLRGVVADVDLRGDSLAVRRFATQTVGRDRSLSGGTAELTGFLTFPALSNFSDFSQVRMGLRLYARNALLIDRPRVATLAVTTTTPLTLTGPYTGAVLRGAVRVEEGVIAIPELLDKQVIDPSDPELLQVVDTSLFINRTLLSKYAQDTTSQRYDFVKYLSAENVTVTIGDNVWLRSAEANIKLGGTLNVRRGGSTRADVAPQLALDGTLETVRGTYRLDLVAVQPIFEVERGTLKFFGDPDLNPTLDISALHTVRQPRQAMASNRPDVRVRVRIEGTLAQPTLSLSSADDPPIPTSDLLSYLITGEPALQLGESGSRSGEFGSILLRTGSSLLSSFAANRLGFFDVVQLQTAGAQGGETLFSVGQFSNARLGLGKQIGNRTFISLNTGICPLLGSGFSSGSGTDGGRLEDRIREQLGGKLEHRFNHGFSAEIGIEPGASSLTCTRGGVQRQLLNPTPSQVGFDLFRQWSF